MTDLISNCVFKLKMKVTSVRLKGISDINDTDVTKDGFDDCVMGIKMYR